MNSIDDLLAEALRRDDSDEALSETDVERAMGGFRRRRVRRLTGLGAALGAVVIGAGVGVVAVTNDRAPDVLVPAASPTSVGATPATGPATTNLVAETSNRPPVANADVLPARAGSSTVIDVRLNDDDPDGDPLAVVALATEDLEGDATITDDGTIRYVAPRFSTVDELTYRIEDPGGLSAESTVTIEVIGDPDEDAAASTSASTTATAIARNRAPSAVADFVSIEVGLTVDIDVRLNDDDPDGDPLAVVALTAGDLDGDATITERGTIRYVAPTFATVDDLTYRIEDPAGLFAESTLTLAVIDLEGDGVTVSTIEP